jgi:hypothetical protein
VGGGCGFLQLPGKLKANGVLIGLDLDSGMDGGIEVHRHLRGVSVVTWPFQEVLDGGGGRGWGGKSLRPAGKERWCWIDRGNPLTRHWNRS